MSVESVVDKVISEGEYSPVVGTALSALKFAAKNMDELLANYRPVSLEGAFNQAKEDGVFEEITKRGFDVSLYEYNGKNYITVSFDNFGVATGKREGDFRNMYDGPEIAGDLETLFEDIEGMADFDAGKTILFHSPRPTGEAPVGPSVNEVQAQGKLVASAN